MPKAQWDKLKEEERYGMMAELLQRTETLIQQCNTLAKGQSYLLDQISRINALEDRMTNMEKRIGSLEINTGQY